MSRTSNQSSSKARWAVPIVVIAAAALVAGIFHQQIIDWFNPGDGQDAAAPVADGHAERQAKMDGGEEEPLPNQAEPINTNCPILGGEIDPKTPTVTWNGYTIGFCCPGCDKKFLAWSDEKKAAFVEQYISPDYSWTLNCGVGGVVEDGFDLIRGSSDAIGAQCPLSPMTRTGLSWSYGTPGVR